MKIENLIKTYHSKCGENAEALKDVSFSLAQNGMVFIVGKSGSGKSTLLNVLSGLDTPDNGIVEIDGKDITKLSSKELDCYRNSCCGFVFQEYNLIPELNVKENISLALELQGVKNTDSNVSEVLGRVGLSGYENRKINELSGGQKQRIAIARALIKNPKIIFADEPTGALDSETGESIFELLKELSKEKLVIVVSHDMDFASRFADRIIELSDGRIISDNGKNEEFSQNEKTDWQKSKLPFKTTLKIGCSNFKFHPIRFIATVLLSVIAFTLLGLSLNVTFTRYTDIVYNAMKKGGIKQSSIVKISENQLVLPIKQEDMQFFDSNIGNYFKVLYLPVDIDLLNESDSEYYSTLPYGYSEISISLIEAFGFSLVGKLPDKKDEIAITKFSAEILNELNFSEDFINNIIGKSLIINGSEYFISAIIDTAFNELKYENLKDPSYSGNLSSSFYEDLYYSVHNLIFVYDLNEYKHKNLEFDDNICNLVCSNSFPIHIREINPTSEHTEIYKLNDNSNGCYLPSYMISSVMHSAPCDKYYNGKRYFNFGELFNDLCDSIPNESSNDLDYFLRVFDENRKQYNFPDTFPCVIKNERFHFELKVNINGFYTADKNTDTLLLDEVYYQELYKKIGGEFDSIVVFNENESVKQFIGKEISLRLNNSIIRKIDKYEPMITSFKKIAFILALVFLFFSIILFLNFILQNLNDKTKTIGILKANGASDSNLLRIFLIESLIIGTFVFLFSTISTVLICLILNKTIAIFAFFGINIFVYPALFTSIFLFSSFGCVPTISRLLRFSPNDIIKKI